MCTRLRQWDGAGSDDPRPPREFPQWMTSLQKWNVRPGTASFVPLYPLLTLCCSSPRMAQRQCPLNKNLAWSVAGCTTALSPGIGLSTRDGLLPVQVQGRPTSSSFCNSFASREHFCNGSPRKGLIGRHHPFNQQITLRVYPTSPPHRLWATSL
jgi:hypothetical protein